MCSRTSTKALAICLMACIALMIFFAGLLLCGSWRSTFEREGVEFGLVRKKPKPYEWSRCEVVLIEW